MNVQHKKLNMTKNYKKNHKQENHDFIYENVEMEEEWWTCKNLHENMRNEKYEHEEEAPLSMNHLLFMEEASSRR